MAPPFTNPLKDRMINFCMFDKKRLEYVVEQNSPAVPIENLVKKKLTGAPADPFDPMMRAPGAARPNSAILSSGGGGGPDIEANDYNRHIITL